MPVTMRWLLHVLRVAVCLQQAVELDRCWVGGDVNVDVEVTYHDDIRKS